MCCSCLTFAEKNMAKTKPSDKRRKQVGEKLKKMRVGAGYKSAEIFAYDNELNRVQYWRMEKGANFTMDSLMNVLEIHKITMSEFFKDLK